VLGAALAAGLHDTAWWIIAGCGAAVLVLGAVTTGRWAARTAERTAELLIAPEGAGNRTAVKA
jgi:hypothetical protein